MNTKRDIPILRELLLLCTFVLVTSSVSGKPFALHTKEKQTASTRLLFHKAEAVFSNTSLHSLSLNPVKPRQAGTPGLLNALRMKATVRYEQCIKNALHLPSAFTARRLPASLFARSSCEPPAAFL